MVGVAEGDATVGVGLRRRVVTSTVTKGSRFRCLDVTMPQHSNMSSTFAAGHRDIKGILQIQETYM